MTAPDEDRTPGNPDGDRIPGSQASAALAEQVPDDPEAAESSEPSQGSSKGAAARGDLNTEFHETTDHAANGDPARVGPEAPQTKPPRKGGTKRRRQVRRVDPATLPGTRHRAPFSSLVEARFGLTYAQWSNAPQATLERLQADLLEITDEFEKENGLIVYSAFCPSTEAAAVLTDAKPGESTEVADNYKSDLRIHRQLPPLSEENSEAVGLLLKCQVLAQQASAYLHREDGDRCISMAYGVVEGVLSQLESRARKESVERVEPSARTIEMLRGELQQAQAHYDAAVQRKDRTRYLLAMIPVALFFLPGIAVGAYFLLRGADISGPEVVMGAAAFAAGAVGAAVSVMLRMTGGRLTVQTGLGSGQVAALGAFRPVVGAIFALAFFFFVRSDLIPMAVPTDATTQIYFFSALGFIAGFSERLAQDTIESAEGTLPGISVPRREPPTPAASP